MVSDWRGCVSRYQRKFTTNRVSASSVELPDGVDVHVLGLADREGDGSREGIGGDSHLGIERPNAFGCLRISDAVGELRRYRARRNP